MLISVVIPTYNRNAGLLKTLGYLDNQILPKNLYEVLIIDDGSKSDVEKFVEKYTNKYALKYFKKTHGGPGDARNLGIRRAKGDIIAFTDDDCIIPPDWLKNIYDSFINNPDAAGVEGKTISFIDKLHPLSHQVINTRDQGIFPTCNMAYKKIFLEKAGGFYSKFRHPHNEDIDLAWNVLRLGRIIFDSSVEIIHPVYYKNIFKKLLWTYYFKDEFMLYNRHRELYGKMRGGNPWLFIYFHFYVKYNYFFLLRKYIRHRKSGALSLLSAEIAVFLILQGLLLFFLAFFFIYRHNEK